MERIKFKINGKSYSVGCEVSSREMLVDYIRNKLELRGTKYMCREGGCGACIVAVTKYTGGPILAVNSCLVPITACHDWEITTIENLGNRKKGFHALQKTLATNNGTQCGHCSPGFVMSMYCTLQSKNNLTMQEIEQSFGSNICRCTGYRPILEAFKTFASDSSEYKIKDIEDLDKKCIKDNCIDADWCFVDEFKTIKINLKDNKIWYKVYSIDDICQVLCKEGCDDYMLVAGDTAKGAYPINEYPKLLIDISSVSELKSCIQDQNLIVGAGTTLTELSIILEEVSKREEFSYLKVFIDHLKYVAHPAVRNIGTIGGNLVIKNQHPEFPSDIYLLFETVNGFLTIQNCMKIREVISMQDFLQKDLKGYIIVNVLLPPLSEENKIYTIKVSPRSQNSHGVSAAFHYKLGPNNIVLESRIVYAGLSSSFQRALKTETFLNGKVLFRNDNLQQALIILEKELVVDYLPGETSVEYRRELALALLYKSILHFCPISISDSRYRSGSIKIHTTRPVSKACQLFDTKPSLWPLNQPLPKIDALIQCAGEAQYTDDLPTLPYEVFAAFCLSTVAIGTIVSIDASEALKYPGVISFYSAKDIPGDNNFLPIDGKFYVKEEEVLCSGSIKYYNQPYGIVVAEAQQIADAAAKMVKVMYTNIQKPVLNIEEALKDSNRIKLFFQNNAKEKGNDVFKIIRGQNTIRGTYHFSMETLVNVTVPTEEGLKVFASTQWIDGVQNVVSKALKIDANRIDVCVRRLGGSFGIKSSRAHRLAVAGSLVSYKLNRPCRMIQSLQTNTRSVGKRTPSTDVFEVAVNKSGAIQHLTYNLFEDSGYIRSELLIKLGVDAYYNCYDKSRWNFTNYNCITDNPKNSWFRAPSTFEHIAMTELIMEQIAYELSLDPLEVRLANIDYTNYKDIVEMINDVKKLANYEVRREVVNKYNQDNRWTKRGLRFSLLRWTSNAVGQLAVTMSVFHTDGTVAIVHGGVEMGQGINTKAIQICAHLLNISINKVVIKPNDTMIAPNCFGSVGSVTSQNAGYGVMKCCEELLKRLEPIRTKLGNPSWEELIQEAYKENIDLQTHYNVTVDEVLTTVVYGVALAEVEVDILTGQSEVLRVDLMEDVGQSVSPEIDVGQVEGAFIMGQGAWTYENLMYNSDTGELLTDRTWNYIVPQARDIPQDFRVYFRKNSYSKPMIFGSKCVGEPPICLSVVIEFAIREAVTAARLDACVQKLWFPSTGPFTIERIFLKSESKKEDYVLY